MMRPLQHLFLLATAWTLGCTAAPMSPLGKPTASPHTTANTLFSQGMDFAHHGDLLRAEQYITLAVEAGFPRERSIWPLVQACVASSRLRAALNHAQPFLRSHPQAWRLRYLVASIELALGHARTALAELDRVVAQQPDAAEPRYLMAVIRRDAFRDEVGTRRGFEAYVANAPHGPYAPEALAWLSEHPGSPRGDQPSAAAVPQVEP